MWFNKSRTSQRYSGYNAVIMEIYLYYYLYFFTTVRFFLYVNGRTFTIEIQIIQPPWPSIILLPRRKMYEKKSTKASVNYYIHFLKKILNLKTERVFKNILQNDSRTKLQQILDVDL